jgi:hypothetical protein
MSLSNLRVAIIVISLVNELLSTFHLFLSINKMQLTFNTS